MKPKILVAARTTISTSSLFPIQPKILVLVKWMDVDVDGWLTPKFYYRLSASQDQNLVDILVAIWSTVKRQI